MPSALSGPCRILQWASGYTRKLVASSLGGESYAFSEMVDHMAFLREVFAPSKILSPGMICFEECDGFPSRLGNRDTMTGKYLARHPLGIRRAPERSELGNVC